MSRLAWLYGEVQELAKIAGGSATRFPGFAPARYADQQKSGYRDTKGGVVWKIPPAGPVHCVLRASLGLWAGA